MGGLVEDGAAVISRAVVHSSKRAVNDANYLEMGSYNGAGAELSDMVARTYDKLALESKGTWIHAAYHLTSATAGPLLLGLPFAMAAMGWGPGILALAMGAAVSYYSCYLLSLAMEHMEQQAKRSIRFSDLSEHIIGSSWTRYVVSPLQLTICFMVVIQGMLLGGEAIKGMYYSYFEEGSLQLYEFIVFFGVLVLLLAQIPSMHSLRHFNMLSILLCCSFSLCVFIGSLIAGYSKEAHARDYTIPGSEMTRTFGIFIGISVMLNSYSNPLVVEIQASLAEPAEKKMVKGLGVCYGVALCTFFPVAVSGYWAFGNKANGFILRNMFQPKQFSLVPWWLYFTANACICSQLVVYTVLHLHPTFERLERKTTDVNQGKYSKRNFVGRLLTRSSFVVLSTFLAAMLPFSADFGAITGAVGFTPLCVFLPMLFYNRIFKPAFNTISFWVNSTIMSAALVIMVLGGISSVHSIIIDARTYKLFADV